MSFSELLLENAHLITKFHYVVHSIQAGQGEPDVHMFTLGDCLKTRVRIFIFYVIALLNIGTFSGASLLFFNNV